jgi:Ca2+-transporting ATPase
MAYMGTTVTYGRGLAVLTATGMQTELGRIADLIQTVGEEPSPLQRRLDQLGQVLVVIALAIVAVIFVLGVLRGEELRLMFLTAVSLAVAAVPEGLPAVVTIALALGAQSMLRRNALIRRLPAVETLGSVTVICSDKTGTLTQNRMTVTVIDTPGKRVDLTESLNSAGGASAEPGQEPALLAAAVGALCNDAVLQGNVVSGGGLQAIGDPTETALVRAAARFGLLKPDLERVLPRNAEAPFDSQRKRMTTLHRWDDGAALPGSLSVALAPLRQQLPQPLSPVYCSLTKGAVDRLLGICTEHRAPRS